jgi:hypothetical protein
MLTNGNPLFKAERTMAVALVGACCLLFAAGCGDGNSAPIVKALALSPGALALSLGVPGQVTAVGTFSDGGKRDLTALVSWESSGANVATVSSRGTVTPLAVGQTIIRAKYGSVAASVQVNVLAAKLISLSISPSTTTLPLGKGTQLIATGRFTDNSSHDISGSVTWTSSNPTVAAVAQDGQLKSNAVGAATVSAIQGTIASSANVTISDAALAAIVIGTDSTVLAVGRKAQLKAQGTFTDGTSREITNAVTWSSSSPNVVAISPGGVAQAKAVGTASVSAALGPVSSAQALTATGAALSAITVNSPQSLLPAGTTTQLTATGTYSDGTAQDLTASVQWWSSSQQIVAVSGTGVASAIAIGSAKVVASSGGVSGSTLLAVSPAALVSVNVSPQQSLIPIGHKQQLSAIGSFTDGTTYDLTSYASWNSDNVQVAAVDAHGMAFAANVGSANVQASYQAMVGTAAVTVQPQLNIVYFHLPANGPDTTMRISNPGLSGTDLCAMIYVFDQKQQLVECCGCPVSLDGLRVLSLRNDLMANPLTGIRSTDGVVEVIAAAHVGNPNCDASSINPSGIVAAWSTNLASTGNGTYAILEDNAAISPLSNQQLSASQAQCYFAKTLGSGQGICSCGTGH